MENGHLWLGAPKKYMGRISQAHMLYRSMENKQNLSVTFLLSESLIANTRAAEKEKC